MSKQTTLRLRARRKRRAIVMGALATVCTSILGACSTAPTTTSPTVEAVTGGQITPLLDSTLSTPRWFTGTDGKAHLAYELLLTNAIPASVTLSSVEVHDADSDATLIRLTGDSLLAAISLAASADTPSVILPPSSVGIVWMDIPLAVTACRAPSPTGSRSIRRRTSHSPSGTDLHRGAVQVDRRPPVVLGLRWPGAGWAALGSCCDGPHRRALYPIDGRWYLAQRFAIDFNQLDAENRPGVGDPLLPTSFPTFGQPVYAVADGTVVLAVDEHPDLFVGEPAKTRRRTTRRQPGGARHR